MIFLKHCHAFSSVLFVYFLAQVEAADKSVRSVVDGKKEINKTVASLQHGNGSLSFGESFLKITATVAPISTEPLLTAAVAATAAGESGEKTPSVPDVVDATVANETPAVVNITAPFPANHFTTVYTPLPSYATYRGGPMVVPIIVGSIDSRAPVYEMFSTVVLIRDGNNDTCNILVDTGLPIDRNVLIANLATHGVRPNHVHYVVLTHGHPDHTGNQNLFPSARTFFGRLGMRGHTFIEYRENIGPDERRKYVNVCQNSRIYATAGHTSSDLTLLVNNVQDFGAVAITGDLFINENDYGGSEEDLWRKFSSFPQHQQESRRMMLCLSDVIFPGHGQPFRVNEQLRKAVGCASV